MTGKFRFIEIFRQFVGLISFPACHERLLFLLSSQTLDDRIVIRPACHAADKSADFQAQVQIQKMRIRLSLQALFSIRSIRLSAFLRLDAAIPALIRTGSICVILYLT